MRLPWILAKRPDDGVNTGQPSSFQEGRISFKDKVLGNRTPLSVKDSGHLLEWNLVRIEYDNGNRLLPRIHIDDGLFNDLCYPWHDSLIIKLLGRNIGYYQLNTRLKGTWKLTGGFELMDVDNGFFMVKFDLEEDRAKVISGGPWMVIDHYLAVSQWF
jgi:hypothetical protein